MTGQEATDLFKESQRLFDNGLYHEAMRILTRLNHFYPNSKNVLFPMAMCLEKLNHTGEALDICGRLIAQFDDRRAHEMKTRLENTFVVAANPFVDDGADLAKDLLGIEPEKKVPVAPKRQVPSWVWFVCGGVALLLLASLPFLLPRSGGASGQPGVAAAGSLAGVLFVLGLLGVGLYVFSCYCLKLICEKAGGEPGVLIWIPLLQFIPLFNAAGLGLIWFFLLFIPFINIVATVMLWVKLCEARGKPSWMGIFILFPGLNLFLVLYLAFAE